MASASYIKGITVKIEGDSKGLAKSLSDVNNDLKKTNSALKDVEKALKLDPGNVELLEQKQELLNKQIEQTKTKLDLERQAAEHAKEALDIGNITQEEYASLTAEVATTESQLNSLEAQASASAETIEETGEAASNAGAEAETSGDSFINWGDVVAGAAKVAATAVAAVGAAVVAMGGAVVEGGKALVGAAKDVSDYGEEVDKASQRVGMSTDTYQKWDYVMQMSGTSMSAMEGGLKSLNNTFDDARNGSQSAIEKFEAIGLSMEEIANMSREDLFGAVISGLQGVSDESQRAALANDLLARAGTALIPMLNSTEDEIQGLLQEAEDYGVVMSSDMVEASAEYNDALYRMDAAMNGLRNRVVGQFLPGLTQTVNGLAGMAAGIDGAEADVSAGVDNIVATFESMIPGIEMAVESLLPSLLSLGQSLITTIANGIIANLGDLLNTALTIVTSLAEAFMTPENLTMLLDAAVQILLTLVTGLIDAIDMLIDPAIEAVLTLVEALLSGDSISKLMDAAIHIILSVVNGLTSALPRLIPAAIEAILTISRALIDHLDEIVLAAEDLIVALASGLVEALPDLLATILTDILPAIINAFMKLHEELPKKALEWGADMIQGLINGVKKMIGKLRQAVSNIADTIASYLHFSVPDVGPLADFDKSGPDMIDVFAKGMIKELPTLQMAAQRTAAVLAGSSSPDYSGALSGISSQIAGIGNNGTYVINVQVGSTTLATAVLSAQQMEAFRTGGT